MCPLYAGAKKKTENKSDEKSETYEIKLKKILQNKDQTNNVKRTNKEQSQKNPKKISKMG